MRIQDRYELAEELRQHYWAADRRERGRLLDALCLATGYNRKYAIAVLRGRQRVVRLVRRPPARRYGIEFRNALKVLWEAAGYICSERLQPFIPELVPLLKRHDQLKIDDATEALLQSASLATIERNLVPLRRGVVARKMSQTSFPSRCWASIRTTAASFSTITWSPTAQAEKSKASRRFCWLAPALNTRTTIPTSSRRTGPWSGGSSATNGSIRPHSWPGSTASTPNSCVLTTTASSRS